MSKGFPGIPGGMGALQGMMKQAQKMQEQIQVAQQQAELFESEGSAGGGAVKIVASGKNRLVSVKIDAQVVQSGDTEMLQDLILAAANDALNKVQENTKKELGKVTGGMSIPGLA